MNDLNYVISNSKFILLRWNEFRITYGNYKFHIEYKVVVETNRIGEIGLRSERLSRLEVMKELSEKGYSSKGISEFLNVNGIKPLRTDTYSPKLVWVSLKKYNDRLNRKVYQRVVTKKETLFVTSSKIKIN